MAFLHVVGDNVELILLESERSLKYAGQREKNALYNNKEMEHLTGEKLFKIISIIS